MKTFILVTLVVLEAFIGQVFALHNLFADDSSSKSLLAGAAVVDISPRRLPVIQNGGFISKTTDHVAAPIYARSLALRNQNETIVIAIVDSCMIPREVCDVIKEEAAARSGVRPDRMLIAATHTHSAPSTMDYCLGAMQDRDYTVQMIPQVADAIAKSIANLEPAMAGWTAVDAWDYTNCRRWIKRSDKIGEDPFGKLTVRAMMHPNPLSEYIGPSGPEDPAFTLLSIVRLDRSPLAMLANFSMHYHGHGDGIHPDYFGIFAKELEDAMRGKSSDKTFVGIMSQGTSGDLHLRTYDVDRGSEPKPDAANYAKSLVDLALKANQAIQFSGNVALAMAQREIEIERRLPDSERMAWAKDLNQKRGETLPRTRPEVYAMQAQWIHDNPRSKLIVQAIRIGELGIAAMPNEVFGITGLKIKTQSPLPLTMNLELANGADGYIPPREQHHLGGYTTWPSRTAGLEVQAEPKIVEGALSLLEQVSGKQRTPLIETHGVAAQAILALMPQAFWRFSEMIPAAASDASEHRNDGHFEDGVAYYLPGVGSKPSLDMASATPEQPSSFSGTQINRTVHFAGGRMHAHLKRLPRDYSLSLWVWNGFPIDQRAITGYVFSRGRTGQSGDHLGIGGTHQDSQGKLVFFNGSQFAAGKTSLSSRAWHHVVLIRENKEIRLYLNGNSTPELKANIDWTLAPDVDDLYIGGRCDGMFGFEGKLDEVAVFDRVLNPSEIDQIFSTSGRAVEITNKVVVQPPISAQPALSPSESLKQVFVPEGYRAEIVAEEPNVLDPVAFDWDTQGRLWVVEMADYPLGVDNQEKPGGRVRLLEDLNGDGVYEKGTLFADELRFPNGVLTWRDGVIITAAPEILFLKDEDGDGRADYREVLLSGLNEGNQQLRPNGLRWGLDNWVYVASGSPGVHRSAATPLHSLRNGTTLEVGTNDFRFRPDTGELEIDCGPTQFGRNRDDWGRWFGTQNMRPLWHYVMSESYMKRNPFVVSGETQKLLLPVPAPVYPAHSPEKRFHSYSQAGHYTSACAGLIHRDPKMFGEQLNGFACEPFHNLVQQIAITEEGASYSGRAVRYDKRDFITSTDRWFRPVMIRTGPDGALWVADMYRFMIEHPQFLTPEGKEELLPHYRKGDDQGRIYRISTIDMPRKKVIDFSRLSSSDLLALLDSENGFIRDKVHQLLLWKADLSLVPELRATARRVQQPRAALHALCILDGLHQLQRDDLSEALRADHPGLRENALRLSERWLRGPAFDAELLAAVIACGAFDNSKVQLQTALTLGESDSSMAGRELANLMMRHHADPLMLNAILTSVVPHLSILVDQLQDASDDAIVKVLRPLLQVAIGRDDRTSAAKILNVVQGHSGDLAAIGKLQNVVEVFNSAGTKWKALIEANPDDELGNQFHRIEQMLTESLSFAANDQQPFKNRLSAALVTSQSLEHRDESLELISGWLDSAQPLEVQLSVINALAKSGSEKVPEVFSKFFPSSGPAARNALIEGWLSRELWCIDLLNRIKRNQIPGSALDATHRSRLFNHQVGRVKNLALQAIGQSTTIRAEVIAKYKPALSLSADAERGHAVYQKVCAACHRHGNEGIAIGPDMSTFVSHTPEKLLANILDPNIDIQPGYQAFVCMLHSGEQLFGVITQETSASINIKGKEGIERRILRSEIEAMKGTNVSFMPEGLEANVDLQQMADLLTFLVSQQRTSGK